MDNPGTYHAVLQRHRWLLGVLPLGTAVIIALVALFLSQNVFGTVAEKLVMSDTTLFHQQPRFVGEVDFLPAGSSLRPYCMALTDTSLVVASIGSSRLFVLDDDFEVETTIDLQTPQASLIGGIALDETAIYVADFGAGELGVYDWQGKRIDFYALMPDGKRSIRPYNLSLFDGILYVTDPTQRTLHVITAQYRGERNQRGELLFSIDMGDSSRVPLQYPSSTFVTPDGRLLVSDMAGGQVHAFTCSGRYGYPFAVDKNKVVQSPHMIAMDHLANPELVALDKTMFDPSGILCEGRIHVVDREAGEIAVYDPRGKPVLRYGSDHLHIPNGIVIDQRRRAIIIADSQNASLIVYKY